MNELVFKIHACDWSNVLGCVNLFGLVGNDIGIGAGVRIGHKSYELLMSDEAMLYSLVIFLG